MGFTKFGLNQKLLDAIKEMGFSTPTQIQERTIPLLLEGKDVVGHSQTGSGKTAAFGLPILEKVVLGQGPQALILTPTRELAAQVMEDLEKMGKNIDVRTVAIYGGVGYGYQTEGARNSEIIIATPGRLMDHLDRRTVSLNKIKIIVLDEADRMLDMGFEKSVNKILSQSPKQRQMIMFSATMPISAQRMIKKYMKNPVYVEAEKQVHADLLKHTVYKVNREHKFSLLVHLLKQASGVALVFCRTKRETDKVAKNLHSQGFKARPVHGDLTQNKRQQAVKELKEGKIDVLVATDVAARGLHIGGISHVYNYDVPDNAEDYTHRIGRTARAGMKGEAVTIMSDRDADLFRSIIKAGMKIEELPLPEFEKVVLVKDEFNLPRSEKRRQAKGEYEEGFRERRSFGRDRAPRRDGGRSFGRSSGRSFDRGNRGSGARSGGRSFGGRDRAPQRDFDKNFAEKPIEGTATVADKKPVTEVRNNSFSESSRPVSRGYGEKTYRKPSAGSFGGRDRGPPRRSSSGYGGGDRGPRRDGGRSFGRSSGGSFGGRDRAPSSGYGGRDRGTKDGSNKETFGVSNRTPFKKFGSKRYEDEGQSFGGSDFKRFGPKPKLRKRKQSFYDGNERDSTKFANKKFGKKPFRPRRDSNQ